MATFRDLITRMLGEMVDHGFEAEPPLPLHCGQVIGWVEGFKAASDVYCVMNGTFAGGNPLLKEDACKAWSSLGDRVSEHWDVSVQVDHRTGEFAATILPDAGEFTGRYVTVENRHLALVTVER